MRKTEFDIEKAKKGAKLVTRNGEPVRIICLDRHRSCYPIVALIGGKEEERIEIYTSEGKHRADGEYSCNDLFILEEPTVKPYVNAEEMDAAIKEHGMFVKDLYGRRFAIVAYDDENVSVGVELHEQYKALLEFYEWPDCTPCGVPEGGEE